MSAVSTIYAVFERLTASKMNLMVSQINSHNHDGTYGVQVSVSNVQGVYPVGSIYINASVSTNPATLLGFGTWAAFGSGRVLVGVDVGQTEFDSLGETGGEKTHTLTEPEIPAHTHSYLQTPWTGSRYDGSSSPLMTQQTSGTTGSAGGGQAHNNLQPYITVYMWRRTA
jgi:microcystin-dependent protein